MNHSNIYSYMSPKLEAHANLEKGGYGVFTREKLEKDELLAVWGGVVVSEAGLGQISLERATHGIQVEEGLFLVPMEEELDPADMFNHSCNPNSGLSGQIALVAMREIAPGEEICFDYAMSDSTDYDEFDCGCGQATCRKRITGGDWRLADLQERYAGYFSPYLQRRIAGMRGGIGAQS